MNLLEAYAKRLSISESVYSKQHMGAKMDNYKKLAVAKVLENTNKFLNEAFNSTVGTQRSDMGLFKKFCLNLTTVALPNLIAHDLVLVSPMASMTGYVTYIEYQYSTTKGDAKAGDAFNTPWKLNNPVESFTSERVVETVEAGETSISLSWTPIVRGAFTEKTVDANGNIVEGAARDVKITHRNGTVEYKTLGENATTVTGLTAGDRVAYVYDNIVVPQNNIPSIKAEMKSIPLLAKARRIAVYYSQIAAFQAKTDYGFDLGDQLAEKAVGQLSYEIDTEIVKFLEEIADKNATDGFKLPAWDRTIPVGVSKSEHYEGFCEIVEIGRQMIYDRTQRFAPNYMVIASNILPILTFIKGFQAAPAGQINGPYFAGTLNGLKVYVSPAIEAGKFFLGVNGDDMMSSVAVYAPYMAVVPTQLLQYADGGTSQGWSTMYDLKALNENLIIEGHIDGLAMGTVYGNQASPVYTVAPVAAGE